MMKVWVLTADTITDVSNEVLESGKVVGIYSSFAAAETGLKETLGTSYWHKEYDYTIDEMEIKN